jgi:hypothetical protein
MSKKKYIATISNFSLLQSSVVDPDVFGPPDPDPSLF